jgi:hypothetical protein
VFQKVQLALKPTQLAIPWVLVPLIRGVMLTTHLQLLLQFRISAVKIHTLQYATGT